MAESLFFNLNASNASDLIPNMAVFLPDTNKKNIVSEQRKIQKTQGKIEVCG